MTPEQVQPHAEPAERPHGELAEPRRERVGIGSYEDPSDARIGGAVTRNRRWSRSGRRHDRSGCRRLRSLGDHRVIGQRRCLVPTTGQDQYGPARCKDGHPPTGSPSQSLARRAGPLLTPSGWTATVATIMKGMSASDIRQAGQDVRAVLQARWSLRRADRVGERVRVRGRPAVTNHGHMLIGDRVQLVSTIATLELVCEKGGTFVIGERTLVNFGGSLVATELLRIGARCQIGPYAMLLDNDYHRIEPERRLERPPSAPIVVEDNVWLGARVIVIAGVTIGADSCVGAGSVVTADVAPRSFVAGVPARFVRTV